MTYRSPVCSVAGGVTARGPGPALRVVHGREVSADRSEREWDGWWGRRRGCFDVRDVRVVRRAEEIEGPHLIPIRRCSGHVGVVVARHVRSDHGVATKFVQFTPGHRSMLNPASLVAWSSQVSATCPAEAVACRSDRSAGGSDGISCPRKASRK